jgi:hypothetical protein
MATAYVDAHRSLGTPNKPLEERHICINHKIKQFHA